jgi:long-subunit acyl-CoA synthetase (AMP-forming)
MSATESGEFAAEAALSHTTMCEAFQATAAVEPDAIALRTADGSLELSWADYAGRVRLIAGGLASLGVARGDTVGLLLANRPEFHLCDTAAFHLGATPYSIYNTSSPEQIAHVLTNAESRVLIAEAQYLDRIRAAGVDLDAIVVLDGDGNAAGCITLEDLERRGGFDFESAWRAVGPDDVLTLIYTSGTTGPPKGVELTHANLLAECQAMASVLPVRRGARITSYLPHAHIADRWASHYNSIAYGVQVTCVADPRQIAAVLPDVRPTIWGAVPRVVEKLKAALEAGGVTEPSALPDEAKAAIRAKIGLDQAEWILVGAAPLTRDVQEYLLALGLPLSELYGMSECSCCVTACPPAQARIGSVGRALPGVELSIADDRELLVRGPVVMRGYRNDPERTAEAIDSDGWVHTGDIASIDEDGFVRIVDRKKELIINAGGKNMSPANIESELKSASPLIGQAIVIGDGRPYNVALLVLDPDAVAGRGAEDPAIAGAVEAAVERANSRLSRVEQIKRFELLTEEWLPGGEELTPTMKLKRRPIADKYAGAIERLYAG